MNDTNPQSTSNSADKIDFAAVIAVAIHDMKNSLSLLMQSIEDIAAKLPPMETDAMEKLTSVHYEASRMNTSLVQMLGLYRTSIDALPINIDEVFVNDLIQEIIESNATYINQKKIKVTLDIDEDLSWFFDRELIYLIIYDVIINASRYGCSNLNISAKVQADQLQILIIDDGPGYPDSMLQSCVSELNSHYISEGRTGLGLYFARLIANTHKNAGKQGEITLSNSESGGSIFSLVLP